MSMRSKVSRRLTQGIAEEVLANVYRPRLAAEFVAVFPALSQLNQAHLVMLARQGIVSSDVAGRLASALIRIDMEGPDAIEPDPALEDAYFNVEARLVALTDSDTGGRLHIGRSRNDLGSALDRMRARRVLLEMLDELCDLRQTFLEQGDKFADVVMPGHTHLQPAQPITFGFYLTGLASALARDAGRLLDTWPRLNVSPMGAAALATTPFPIDRPLVAELLGFDGVLEHGLDCVASRDFALELVAAAAQLALTLSRFAEDLHVAVSHEFSAVVLPDGVCGTSSIMPQKKNPVVLEHLKGKAAHVVAAFASAGSCVRASHFTNTQDAHREGLSQIWPALVEARRAIALANIAAATVEPRAELLLHRARANFSTATDLADLLVLKGGLDFRTSHHVTGAVVRALMDAGLCADDATKAMVDAAARQQTGRSTQLTDDDIACALDPGRSVASRNGLGGTAPEEVRRMARVLGDALADDRRRLAEWKARVGQAGKRLEGEVRALVVPHAKALSLTS